ncbi:MAG: CapA family protein [Candidatus Shapirobacteria bacterium]|nr:CapA family protein [Candidatus Shapirobacteria bacterium]
MTIKKNRLEIRNWKLIIIFLIFLLTTYFLLPKTSFAPSLEKNTIRPAGFLSNLLETPETTISFALTGDLGLGRFITATARARNDFSWSFQHVSSVLKANDFNLANLESPIIDDCPEGKTGTFTFCGDSRFIPYLKENKFIFNLANNHIFNYGQQGFSQTKKYLSDNQIDYFYSHNSDTEFIKKEINGITFGFLGFDLITNPKFDENEIINLVKKYNLEVDWLIVSIHWGNEYLPKAETWRVNLAHKLVDVGADIIHGHHPHVLQENETYKNKVIFYSLGNFIFDQNWSKETSNSELVILKVNKFNILETIKKPYVIKYNSQPQFLD